MKKIMFYTIFILGIGFVFRGLDGWEVNAMAPGMGQLFWLITPLIAALVFRYLLKNKSDWGLNPKFRENWYWYLISFLLFPLLFVLLIFAGISVGSIENLKSFWTIPFFLAVLTAVPTQFFKNIIEEFVWRGFLFSQLEKQGISGLKNHLAVGIVWAIWHVPYIDAFAQIYHDMSWQVYLPLFLVGVVVTSIIYGEIRRRSGTVWTAVILHTTANAFVNILFIKDFIRLEEGKEWWIAPAIDNMGYIILMGIVGIVLYKMKKRLSSKTNRENIADNNK